ncbi:MAG: gliding motility lipoprotein GldH [Dysgonamonadaceae bacterium]|jgi:gliding motility-associated lipoprotein GldH|nr:gliding motility lipoprotein GldH [Dysgonamonadaceae bacterium]
MNFRKINYGALGYLFFLLTACSQNEIFSGFHSFSGSQWPRNEKATFEVEVKDNTHRYDVCIEIRNNNNYPFRNLWLFVDITTPAKQQRTDTVNVELADIYGKWYGRGMSLYSYSFPFEQAINYPASGIYTYSVRQGMRAERLKGISDIGLTVVRRD